MKKGIVRILKAFKYSWCGFKVGFRSEVAFRQDLFVFIVGVLVAVFLNVSYVDKILLVSSLFLILLMELVNTAVEMVVDRISLEYHLLSKNAKDIGSLLVLISFINAIIIWCVILYNNLWVG